jgi:hypothetical protein
MRRPFLLSLGLCVAIASACDPDLKIQKAPGDGGTEDGSGPLIPPPAPGDDAGDDGGPTEGGDGGGDGGGGGHPFTGSPADFAAGEKLATTSPGPPDAYNAFVAWDAKNVYLGMEGKDVGSGATDKWVLVYLGAPGSPGTTQGIGYNCGGGCMAQQPTLPFSASTHVRWKTQTSPPFSDIQKSTGGAWTKDGLTALPVKQNGNFVELSISRASLGDPSKLDVHITMIIEEPPGAANGGWTYAGAPSTSFSDGFNPVYAHYYEFDLTDLAKAPNTYAPK